jgi:hypothetical protein
MKSGYSFRTCLILPLFLQKGKREETGIKEMVKTFKPDLKEAGAFGQNECHRQFLLHRRALTPPLQGTMPYFLSQFFMLSAQPGLVHSGGGANPIFLPLCQLKSST